MADKFIKCMALNDNGIGSIMMIIASINMSISRFIHIYDSILAKLNELRPDWKEIIKNDPASFDIFNTALEGCKYDLVDVFLQDENWLSANKDLFKDLEDSKSRHGNNMNDDIYNFLQYDEGRGIED